MYAMVAFIHNKDSISIHAATKTKVGFNGSSLNVDEGSGLLNDTLFIEIDGIAEPTLYVQLSMQDGKNNNYEYQAVN